MNKILSGIQFFLAVGVAVMMSIEVVYNLLFNEHATLMWWFFGAFILGLMAVLVKLAWNDLQH